MEILTLLKANIRKKKGTFISILLLTAIIVTVMTTIFSVRDNYDNAINEALRYSDSGDIMTLIRTSYLTDELRADVENHELVERVEYYDAICSNGMHCDEYSDGNSHFLMEMRNGICLFNENLDGFESEIPELQSGEVYLPLGLKSKIYCDVGDTITIDLIFGITEEFTIKGFVQEPTQGAMTIGWKQIFISHEDFVRIYETCNPLATNEILLDATMMMIYQEKESELSTAKFQRQLNLDTGIISTAVGALNTEQSLRYSTMMPDIILDIIMVFAVFLFIIVLIVMSHSIGTEIEIDYTTLGVLKSQGFSESKIRLIFLLQYILAQIAGIVIGSIAAIPIERKISSVCQSITAVLPDNGLSIGKCVLYITIILLISAVLIIIKTRNVAKISPVRAISGGREEIFFDSRLNVPITKNVLSASLSLRQFTSAKKRYIGTIFIVAILTFFMITVNLTGNLLSSRSALSAMGMIIPDIEVFYSSTDATDSWDDIDEIVASHSAIQEKNSQIGSYVSINGENLYCEMYEYPEYIAGIIKGRAPLYDNEIVITDMVADTLDLKMGDEVMVSFKTSESTFIISGIYQSGHDSGMSFAMNFSGAEKNGANTDYATRYYIIEDKSKLNAIIDEIIEKYGDYVGINMYDEENNPVLSEYDEIVSLLKIIIYSFSILFSLIVVRMVCTKTFIQERTDIGIYKAVGFTSNMLRLQFAIRFLIIAVIGSILGAILSVLLSDKILGAIFGLMGLSKVVLDFTLMSVLLPLVAMSLSFFVFAYLASRKINKVAARELVTE